MKRRLFASFRKECRYQHLNKMWDWCFWYCRWSVSYVALHEHTLNFFKEMKTVPTKPVQPTSLYNSLEHYEKLSASMSAKLLQFNIHLFQQSHHFKSCLLIEDIQWHTLRRFMVLSVFRDSVAGVDVLGESHLSDDNHLLMIISKTNVALKNSLFSVTNCRLKAFWCCLMTKQTCWPVIICYAGCNLKCDQVLFIWMLEMAKYEHKQLANGGS